MIVFRMFGCVIFKTPDEIKIMIASNEGSVISSLRKIF